MQAGFPPGFGKSRVDDDWKLEKSSGRAVMPLAQAPSAQPALAQPPLQQVGFHTCKASRRRTSTLTHLHVQAWLRALARWPASSHMIPVCLALYSTDYCSVWSGHL